MSKKDKKRNNKKESIMCIIGPRSIGGPEGGIEAQISYLLPYFARKFSKIVVFVDRKYLHQSLSHVRNLNLKNIEIKGVTAPYSKSFNKIIISLAAGIYLLKNKVDVAYFNGIGSCLPLLFLKWKKSLRRVVHIRSYDVLYPDWNIIGKMLFAFILMLVRGCSDSIITVNPLFARLIKRNNPFKSRSLNIYHIENAIHSTAKKEKLPSVRVRKQLEHITKIHGIDITTTPYFLFVGRITPFKNLEVLIKAFNKHASKNKNTYLLIAGNIDDKAYFLRLKNIIDVHHKHRIIFLGKVEKETLNILYKHAICLILPSKFEGMPNVVIEGCVHSIPVYVSAISPHLSLKFLTPHSFFNNEKDLEEILNSHFHPRTCNTDYIKKNLSPSRIASKLLSILSKR